MEETNALLNKYIDILAKQEEATRLIFDERWRGAEEVRNDRNLSTTHTKLTSSYAHRTNIHLPASVNKPKKKLNARHKNAP